MQLIQLEKYMIRLLYLIMAGIVVVQAFGQNALVSLLFTATFGLVLVLWLFTILRRVELLDILAVITIALTFLHVLINSWMTHTAISFSYLRKFIMFSCTLLFWLTGSKIRLDRGTARWIMNLNTFLILFLAFLFFTNRAAVYLFDGIPSNYLVFHFSNPNLCALFLVCYFGVEVLNIMECPKGIWKNLHILLAGLTLYFIYETGSRNCLLVICIFLFLYWFLCRKNPEPFIPGWMAMVISWLPLIFAVLYMWLWDHPVVQRLLGFIITEQKQLNARIIIWEPAMWYFRRSPIFGAYSQISRGTGMSQMHNSHIDIMVSYGMPVLLLVCFSLYRVITVSNDMRTRQNVVAGLCFASALISGMNEAAMFSGGLGIYICAGSFLLLRSSMADQEIYDRKKQWRLRIR